MSRKIFACNPKSSKGAESKTSPTVEVTASSVKKQTS